MNDYLLEAQNKLTEAIAQARRERESFHSLLSQKDKAIEMAIEALTIAKQICDDEAGGITEVDEALQSLREARSK